MNEFEVEHETGKVKEKRQTRIILVASLVVVGLFCIIPICSIAILTLLGPQIGDVFSQIIESLEATAVP